MYSFINVLGLIVGISFSCMLFVYVQHEMSYDRFHDKSDRIFRAITIDKRIPEMPRYYGVAPAPLGSELVDKFPEVEATVRLHRFVGQVVIEKDGQNFQERNWFTTTDPGFFELFDFNLIAGNKETALVEPSSLVITKSMATKYFGGEDPLGQVLENTSFGPVKVTGVLEDFPDNSHLKFDMLFSNVRTDDDWKVYLGSWQDFDAYTYVLLNSKANADLLKSRIPAIISGHFTAFDGTLELDFQAMEDIYLHSANIEASSSSDQGQTAYIYVFATMGLFLLVIACINYINLATSKAMSRAREVGIRKVVGAFRWQLITQFMVESFLFTLLAMLVAIAAMDALFPYFNQITGKHFDISLDTLGSYLPPLLAISLAVGVVSGSYPAFYLSRLRPVSSLKGVASGDFRAVALRRGLVVFQFALTIVMIVSTLVIGEQLNFVQQRDLGFDKSQLVVIDINSGRVRQNFEAMKHELASIPGVVSVGVSSRVPGEWKNIRELYVRSSGTATVDSLKTYYMGFDEGMLQTYRLDLLEGEYFASNGSVDSTSILLNEAAVSALGLDKAVGSVVRISTPRGPLEATVAGVLRDFNFQSLHQKVAPIVIGTWNNPLQYIDYFSVRIGGDPQELMPAITAVHDKFDQATPIEYHFLDQQLATYYAAERKVGMIFRMAGGLSIFVACLGLLGLATYNIERRTKELGIRKVLGASAINLFMLLSSSFVRQVALAFVIAAPVSYYVMQRWLSIFQYRIPLHVGIFLMAGAIALLIAMATISYRSIRAAHASPLRALRQE
jgi:putative ABC transport system permease protein